MVYCHRVLVDQSKKPTPSTDRKLARWDVYNNTFVSSFLIFQGMAIYWPIRCQGYGKGTLQMRHRKMITTLLTVGAGFLRLPQVTPTFMQLEWGRKLRKMKSRSRRNQKRCQYRAFLRTCKFRVFSKTWRDTVFGDGFVNALVQAQKEDELYSLMYRKPSDFENFGAVVGTDQILRFGTRIVIPTAFRWREHLCTELLTEYVHLEKTHVGFRNTLAGLKPGFIWDRMSTTVRKFVQECDQCQRSKQRAGKIPGYHTAMPILVAGAKHVAWDFQDPFLESKDVDGVVRTGLWNVFMWGTDYVIMIPISHTVTAEQLADIFVQKIYPTTGSPRTVLSDRDLKFTSAFWKRVVELLPTKSIMSTAFHARTDRGIEGKHHFINMAMTHSWIQSNQKLGEMRAACLVPA